MDDFRPVGVVENLGHKPRAITPGGSESHKKSVLAMNDDSGSPPALTASDGNAGGHGLKATRPKRLDHGGEDQDDPGFQTSDKSGDSRGK